MRSPYLASTILLLLPLTVACGSSDDTAPTTTVDPGENSSSGSHYDYGAAFTPKPAAAGFTRFVAPVVTQIPPGADITYCQYVMAPVDQDMDILRVTGEQSAGGHHTVAYATTKNLTVGSSAPCDDGNMDSAFLGGTGGDGAALELPENTAYRLTKGQGIILNNHYINTSDDYIDGEAVLDLEMVPADPSRRVAGLLAINSTAFNIPANGQATASATCTFERDLEIFAFTNHMHEYGLSASGRVVREPGAAPEVVNTVSAWSPEMAGNPIWSMRVNDTVKVKAGGTVDVQCAWRNTTASAVTFPREMCLTVGMFFATKSETLACMDGKWIDLSTYF